jgi:lipid-binding SYLF domain-containing protein
MLAGGCTTTSNLTSAKSEQSQRVSIDAGVDAAMTNLDSQVPGARELLRNARGVLVFPGVVSAGLVVGGAYGKGALRENGRTAGYYSTTTASIGWLAGAESKAVFVLFMTKESLDKFVASQGWTAGVDASVTLLKIGADGHVTTQTAQGPIVGFVLTNGGLMADLSVEGAKISKIAL